MKRTLAILMAALLMLPACTKEIRTETLQLEEDIPFHEGSPNSINLLLDIDFPVSGFPKAALADVRKAIITSTLGESYLDFNGSLEEMGQAWRDLLVEDYRVSNQSMLEEMEMTEEEAPFLNWGFDRRGAFGETFDHYVNYTVDQYEYMGGAHGMYGTFPLVFDLNNGQVVSWNEVVPGVSTEKMTELITAHRLDDLKDMIGEEAIDEGDIFFHETIEPSDSFTVDAKGLTFYYQPYDIAPYVFGVITIPVPWEELK